MLNDISFKYEVIRKLIHLSSASIPIFYYFFFNQEQALIICGIIFGLFLIADFLTIYVIQLRQIYEKYLGRLLRPEEKIHRKLNGATLLTLGFFLAVILFDKSIAVIVMLFLAVSDSMAALVGKRFGKNKLMHKTWEGSVTFLLVSFLIASFFYNGTGTNLVVVTLTTIAELLPVNDNLTIPLTGGFAYILMLNI
jgi:dolichol kinase